MSVFINSPFPSSDTVILHQQQKKSKVGESIYLEIKFSVKLHV